MSGQVVVKPEGQKGVFTFDVRYALEGAGGVLGPWTTVTIAGPRKTIITGLTMAGIYHFQIRAFGSWAVTPIGWTAKRSSAPNSPVHWAAVPGNRDCRLFFDLSLCFLGTSLVCPERA